MKIKRHDFTVVLGVQNQAKDLKREGLSAEFTKVDVNSSMHDEGHVNTTAVWTGS